MMDRIDMEVRLQYMEAFERAHRPRLCQDSEVCDRCDGNGEIMVGGVSLSPFSGVMVNDPQQAHDEVCPKCRGAGVVERSLPGGSR